MSRSEAENWMVIKELTNERVEVEIATNLSGASMGILGGQREENDRSTGKQGQLCTHAAIQ